MRSIGSSATREQKSRHRAYLNQVRLGQQTTLQTQLPLLAGLRHCSPVARGQWTRELWHRRVLAV